MTLLTRYLTLAFGDTDAVFAQAHYSLLTVIAHAPKPCELVVITDDAARLQWFDKDVRIVSKNRDELDAWKGEYGFLWRIKLEAMRMVQEFGDAHLLYFDGDTICRGDLSELIAGLEQDTLFMHRNEGILSQSRRRGNQRLYRATMGRRFSGVNINAETVMWNAGIVALPLKYRSLIQQATRICDELCAAGIVQHVTEQYATSVALNSSGHLVAAERWFDHYWRNKLGYERAIADELNVFLTRGYDVAEAVEHVRERPIRRPPVARLRWWNRIIRGSTRLG